MRGSAIDFLYTIVFITMLPIIFGLSNYMIISFQGTDLDRLDIMSDMRNALEIWDELFVFMFISLSAVIVALASRVSSHPVFLFFGYLIYAVIVTLAGVISNLYLTIESTAGISVGFVAFELVKSLHQNMPMLITIGVFSVGLVTYSKGDKINYAGV